MRVWFCNQRQKQKRMKFAAQHWPNGNGQANANSNNNSQNASVAAIARQLSIGISSSICGHGVTNNGHNGTNMNINNSLNGGLLSGGGATNLSNGHSDNLGFGY